MVNVLGSFGALFAAAFIFLTGNGLFMVIESWLNECTESRFRGRIFSIYMTLSYLGIGIGQQLLNAGDIQGRELFIIAGIMLALSLVPVSATEGVHPRLPERKEFSVITIFRKAPLGMLGSMVAGLGNSAFYTMTPVVCTDIGLSLRQLSWIMSITVFSGLAAQWTVGTLSDRFDRTVVLSVVATAIAAVSGFMFVNAAARVDGPHPPKTDRYPSARTSWRSKALLTSLLRCRLP